MIPIPESIRVQRCKADEKRLLDSARNWLDKSERAGGIHASDLLDPLLAYWKQVDPQPTTDREVPIFLVGKVLHSFVLGSLDGMVDLNVTDEGSRYHPELKFWYSIDWDKGEVAEFKSSRLFREPKDTRSLDMYIEQTLVYMVAKDVTEAKIWVLYINLRDPATRRTSPQFRAYAISITREDLDKLRGTIVETRTSIQGAIDTGDYSALPTCREFKCGKGNCVYWDRCKPAGRYGTPEWEDALPDDGGTENQVLGPPAPKVPRAKKAKKPVRGVLEAVRTSEVIGDEGDANSPDIEGSGAGN